MDRVHFYSIMNGEGTLDCEIYLNTKALLSSQKDLKDFCNADELQFQLIHQVEEMWMKLIGFTLLDIDDYLQNENTHRVITLISGRKTANVFRRYDIVDSSDVRAAMAATEQMNGPTKTRPKNPENGLGLGSVASRKSRKSLKARSSVG
jgi:hypothetical protein